MFVLKGVYWVNVIAKFGSFLRNPRSTVMNPFDTPDGKETFQSIPMDFPTCEKFKGISSKPFSQQPRSSDEGVIISKILSNWILVCRASLIYFRVHLHHPLVEATHCCPSVRLLWPRNKCKYSRLSWSRDPWLLACGKSKWETRQVWAPQKMIFPSRLGIYFLPTRYRLDSSLLDVR